MLKFLTHKLRTHSINEDNFPEQVDEDHDSGTESDDEIDPQELLPLPPGVSLSSMMDVTTTTPRTSSISPTDTGCSMDSPAPMLHDHHHLTSRHNSLLQLQHLHDPHSSEEELEVINSCCNHEHSCHKQQHHSCLNKQQQQHTCHKQQQHHSCHKQHRHCVIVDGDTLAVSNSNSPNNSGEDLQQQQQADGVTRVKAIVVKEMPMVTQQLTTTRQLRATSAEKRKWCQVVEDSTTRLHQQSSVLSLSPRCGESGRAATMAMMTTAAPTTMTTSSRRSPENEENIAHYGNLSPDSPAHSPCYTLEHSAGSSDEEVTNLVGTGGLPHTGGAGGTMTPVQFRSSPPLEAVKPHGGGGGGGKLPRSQHYMHTSPPTKLAHYEDQPHCPRKRTRHSKVNPHQMQPRPYLDFEKMQQLRTHSVTWRPGDQKRGGELSLCVW